jgi:hypothetical protein
MIERTEPLSPEARGLRDAFLHQPPEPIICWLDADEADRRPDQPVRRRLELLLLLVCCIVLAGFLLANLAQNNTSSGATKAPARTTVVSARARTRHLQPLAGRRTTH